MSNNKQTTPEVKHTPLPYKVVTLPETTHLQISSPMHGAICQIPANSSLYDEHKANAAFIVKACNSHYVLLEALQRIADVDNSTLKLNSRDAEGFIRIAKAAIKNAEQ